MQATLFDVIDRPTADGSAPRCRMCARPAYWSQRTQQWSMYCASRACVNRERLCQSCGQTFQINIDGAGTKYCSLECKHQGYTAAYKSMKAQTRCAWCDTPKVGVRRNTSSQWPYICQPCIHPIRHLTDRLRNHRVDHQRARQLLDEPSCEVCGVDIVTKVRNSAGKIQARLVVDHDHACCPGERSCGNCIRGLICFQCNAAAGMLQNDSSIARALAGYLERASG